MVYPQETITAAVGLGMQSAYAGDIEKDFWLAYDLLQNPKDHAEFTIVRNWVQEALEVHALWPVCAPCALSLLLSPLSPCSAAP